MLQNINFKYPNGSPVLKKVHLSLKAGDKIAIMGRTGSGKSTIFSCIMRDIETYLGCIRIDGKNILEYDIRDIRRSFHIITQDPLVFSGSLR